MKPPTPDTTERDCIQAEIDWMREVHRHRTQFDDEPANPVLIFLAWFASTAIVTSVIGYIFFYILP